MSYITDEMVDWTLKRMVDLETNLNSVYSYHGLKFRENTGRRNATLSYMQEIALAEALNNSVKLQGLMEELDILMSVLIAGIVR